MSKSHHTLFQGDQSRFDLIHGFHERCEGQIVYPPAHRLSFAGRPPANAGQSEDLGAASNLEKE